GLPPELTAAWGEANRRALAGETVTGELEYNLGGARRYFYAILAPIRDQGRPNGVLGVSVDISDRKRAELALREGEVRQRLALDMAELGTWEMDVGSRRAVLSERARACWGLAADEPADRELLFARCHPEDRAALSAAIARAEDPA